MGRRCSECERELLAGDEIISTREAETGIPLLLHLDCLLRMVSRAERVGDTNDYVFFPVRSRIRRFFEGVRRADS